MLAALFAGAACSLALASAAFADWTEVDPVNSASVDIGPMTAVIGPDGHSTGLWVTRDAGADELALYSADGQTYDWGFTTSYTTPGSGELGDVSGLATDDSGDVLYVADRDNARIVAFDVSGGSETAISQSPDGVLDECPGSNCPLPGTGSGEFDDIESIAYLDGSVYALDRENMRVEVFDASLHYERTIASAGWDPGIPDVTEGYKPIAMAVNKATGEVLLAMNDSQSIEVYGADGTYLRKLNVGTGWIYKMAVDQLNNVIYVASTDVIALDYFTGETIATFATANGPWLNQGITGLAVQPLDRTLVASYWYEYASESWAEDFASRFSYDAAPTCSNVAATTEFGKPVAISLSCSDTSASPEVSYEITQPPAHGTVGGFSASAGTLTYTPNEEYGGADSFSYRARSKTGVSQAYTAQVTVGNGPVIRKTANLEPLEPGVLIRLPGSNEWIKLEEAKLIPIGTVIDARVGKARLTLANADGSTYSGEFWGGVFQVLQGSGSNPVATLKLRDDIVNSRLQRLVTDHGLVIARSKGKKKNGLWGNGKGKFRTSGRGGSASVRGTKWWVANYANGTAFRVSRGVVKVTPLHCPAFNLNAGNSAFIYFENQNKVKFVGKRKHPLVRPCKHR